MLVFGYYSRMKNIKQNPYVDMDFECFKKETRNGINWEYTNKSLLYICFDTELEKVVAVMEVNKKEQHIYAIESRFTGNNYAMKLINYYDKKFKTKLQPIKRDIKR